MKADIYYNLHKKCLSIRSRERETYGRVVKHSYDSVYLKDVEFVVNQKGRDKVIATKQKNVHAYIRGVIVDKELIDESSLVNLAKYNPYKYSSFVDKDENPVYKARLVKIHDKTILFS